nr:MAG TPA: hypothetical protein [Caudoviricetes sp.]
MADKHTIIKKAPTERPVRACTTDLARDDTKIVGSTLLFYHIPKILSR